MSEIVKEVVKLHKINIVYNDYIEIEGVLNIVNYDANNIVVKIDKNCLFISGESFDLKSLDLEQGKVIFKGKLKDLRYAITKEKVSLLKRILK